MLVARRPDDHRLRRRRYRRGDRRRRPHGRAGRTTEGADDRAAARPLHHLRLRPRRPPGRRGVPGGRTCRTSCSTSSEDAVTAAKEHGELSASRATRPRTRTCGRPGSSARAGSSSPPTPTPTTSTSSLSARSVRPDIQIVARASDDGRGEEADARGRRPRRDAVHDRRPHDGEPRPEAAGDGVPRRGDDGDRPRPAPGGDRGATRRARTPARTIRDIRVRHETGAIIVALRKRDGTFDTTPEPDAPIEAGDVLVGVGTPEELQRARGSLRAARGRCRLIPSRARGGARHGAGADLELERPSDAEHGDYATNVALRLAGARRQAAARDRGGARRGGRDAARGRARGDRRPGLRQPLPSRRVVRVGARGRSSRRRRVRRRPAPSRGSASRSRWCRRTRPARSPSRPRGTARTATRSRACSSSRAHEVEREYYYNDAGAQMDRFRASVEAVRRGEEPPEDGYHGEYIARARASSRRPGRARCSSRSRSRSSVSAIHFDSWANQSVVEKRAARAPAAARHVREGRHALGALDGVRRRQGPRRSSAPTDGSPTYRAADVAYLARQARARLRPRDLRPRRRPSRLRAHWYAAVARCSATTRSASRCCSTSSST